MAGSAGIAVVAAIIALSSIIPPAGKARAGWTPALIAGFFLFMAMTGALIGYCLALRDLVLERRSKGQRVNPVLRAYFGWGLVSLILWSVTVFAAGFVGIVFYGIFLVQRVGPAR